ncbi:GNAT family N-acetyltransferase [Streptomyces sp. H39-S7]|uniref:GNAT family N-acetyltransferase n=1 Tax=Streptomyces sp. H39-S7 TaxID=3004357 RepID=UPI0022AEC4D8|nr:GNAT family N-acetyltransferase [Streptomyces sp. H39-S7]MCZ4120180.1 GNAT family N-acetyltransferase [Streptomyces sp. H39-S7]
MIRAATPADVPAIHAMIRELAEYEKALEEARATPEQLHDALFGEHPAVFALIAEAESAEDSRTNSGDRTVGFALWFRNFSTWTGTHGVYLEDLYVRPEARGGGHGKALLAELASICVTRGYERFEWAVLDWNDPAIGFYRSIGAFGQDGWTVQRLTGEPLHTLADLALHPSVGNDATSLSN